MSYSDQVLAALRDDEGWRDVHEITRLVEGETMRVRDVMHSERLVQRVASGSGMETTLDALTREGHVEVRKVSPLDAPLGKQWRARCEPTMCASVAGVCWLSEVVSGMGIQFPGDVMIDVTVVETGDVGHGETPSQALLAARTLGREALTVHGVASPTIKFEVGETVVRTMPLSELMAL